jgi:hypothetical protein
MAVTSSNVYLPKVAAGEFLVEYAGDPELCLGS